MILKWEQLASILLTFSITITSSTSLSSSSTLLLTCVRSKTSLDFSSVYNAVGWTRTMLITFSSKDFVSSILCQTGGSSKEVSVDSLLPEFFISDILPSVLLIVVSSVIGPSILVSPVTVSIFYQ